MVLLLVATWLATTLSSGGLHDLRTLGLTAALVPAILCVRPWRHLSPLLAALPAVAAAAGLLTLQTTSTGWRQADSVAVQVLGLLTLVVVAAYARTRVRTRVVVGLVLASAAFVLLRAWEPWWGSGDPNTLVVAPFYWHNQVGAWATATGLLALGPALRAGSLVRRVAAGAVATCCAAVVVLTTSRTCFLLLVAGFVLAVGAAVLARRWRALLALLLLPLATAGLLAVTTGPLFFDVPWKGVAVLARSESAPPPPGQPESVPQGRGLDEVGANGSDRWVWTRSALSSWWDAPVTGNGFGSFARTSAPDLGDDTVPSAFVHDTYAEALTSGGTLFGLPVILGCGAVLVGAVRALWRDRALGPSFALALAAGALLAHTGLDFDGHYAGLTCMLGLVGGPLAVRGRAAQGKAVHALLGAGLLAAVALSAVATLVEHHGRQLVQEHSTSAADLLDGRLRGFDDPRVTGLALALCLDSQGRLAVSPATAREAVAVTAGAAEDDAPLQELRRAVSRALLSPPAGP